MSDSSDAAAAPGAAARKPGRLSPLLKNLALSVCTFLLCVAVLEGVLRVLGYGSVEIYEPDPVLFWKLKPNQDRFTKVDRKPVHINAHGTRGRDFQDQKPPGTIRIVSLGDSRTFGWGLTEGESYSGLLETLLGERFPGRQFEVINAGVNAWSYPQMNAYLQHRALAYQPDFVIVGEANLWTQFSDQADPKFIQQFMGRVRLKNLLRRFAIYHFFIEVQLKEVYERYRTKFIPVDPRHDTLFKEQQQADPDALFRRHVDALCQTALSNGVQPLVIYLPLLEELQGTNVLRIHQVKAELCQRLGLPFIDFIPLLRPQGKALYLDADPAHLNAAGNKIIAGRLRDEISRLLSKK
jgi:lysophospholipase L1-like esterase